MKCKICNDMKYIEQTDGSKRACTCVKMKYLSIYAPQQVASLSRMNHTQFKSLQDQYSKSSGGDFICVPNSNEDTVNVLILLFLLYNECPPHQVMNIYELIEIYLSRHPKFKSLYDLRFPALILLSGYNEFPNVRQNDAILQTLDIMKRNESKVLYISTKSSVDTVVKDYFITHNWTEVKIKSAPCRKSLI